MRLIKSVVKSVVNKVRSINYAINGLVLSSKGSSIGGPDTGPSSRGGGGEILTSPSANEPARWGTIDPSIANSLNDRVMTVDDAMRAHPNIRKLNRHARHHRDEVMEREATRLDFDGMCHGTFMEEF